MADDDGTATTSRRRAVPAGMRVVMRALVAGAVAVAALTLALRGTTDLDHRAGEFSDTRDAIDALVVVEREMAAVQSVYERTAAEPDAVRRAEILALGAAHGNAGSTAMDDYRRVLRHLPDEQRVLGAYVRAHSAWVIATTANGPRLVDPAVTDEEVANLVSSQRILFEERAARLQELRDLYREERDRALRALAVHASRWRSLVGVAIGVLVGVGGVATAVTARRATRAELRTRAFEHERRLAERRADFETRLQRALALATSEPGVHGVVDHALATLGGPGRSEMLLSDASSAHLRRTAASEPDMAGCGVEVPQECPAIRMRQRFDFTSSTALDACPYLRERADETAGCVCLPVTIADRTLAVLRIEAEPGAELEPESVERLVVLARNAGEKTSALRAYAHSQVQASTDPLTGLANRRTLDHVAAELAGQSGRYAVLFADLDHFKVLNDEYSHDVGDRALRVFAHALKEATRPGDLVARYGGEEFVVFLPSAGTEEALRVAERVRETLADELAGGGVPPYTVSIGVASSTGDSLYAEVVRKADRAMLAAKAAGRDRVVAAEERPAPRPRRITAVDEQGVA